MFLLILSLLLATYDIETRLEIGQQASFPDFKIEFKDIKTTEFEIQGVMRQRTEYQFELEFEDQGTIKKRPWVWSVGFPGGRLNPKFKLPNGKKFSFDLIQDTATSCKLTFHKL